MTQGPPVEVRFPRALLEYSGGEDVVAVEARDLAEAVDQLNTRFPGLRERILDDQGRVRQFVHVFVNEDSVGHETPGGVSLESGDRVFILPAVAGGVR